VKGDRENEYEAVQKSTDKTMKQEVGIIKHSRYQESSQRYDYFRDIRTQHRDRLQGLEDYFSTESCKLEGKMLRAEDAFARTLRAKEKANKRLREARLLVSTKSNFKGFFGDQEDTNYKQHESEWHRLEALEKKLQHSVAIEILRLIPVEKLLKKLPELDEVIDQWDEKTTLFEIWTKTALDWGRLLEDRYATQTTDLLVDFDSRCDMVARQFEKRVDHMELDKNARVSNAMAVCQEAKKKFEDVIAVREKELLSLSKDSEWAATEMGALRIEIANLEDEVKRAEELVAKQDRDLALTQESLLQEAFRDRDHDAKQALAALVLPLERFHDIQEELARPPSPVVEEEEEPKPEGQTLHDYVNAVNAYDEPKHPELSTLCGDLADLLRDIDRIGVDEGQQPVDLETYEIPEPPPDLELETQTYKFAESLAQAYLPAMTQLPLVSTRLAERMVEAAEIYTAQADAPQDGETLEELIARLQQFHPESEPDDVSVTRTESNPAFFATAATQTVGAPSPENFQITREGLDTRGSMDSIEENAAAMRFSMVDRLVDGFDFDIATPVSPLSRDNTSAEERRDLSSAEGARYAYAPASERDPEDGASDVVEVDGVEPAAYFVSDLFEERSLENLAELEGYNPAFVGSQLWSNALSETLLSEAEWTASESKPSLQYPI
jgi:hypothetical protein